jgi:bifunctional non-homologous end joining protein LigD
MVRRTRKPPADQLAQYNAKRDFSATPEPAGEIAKGAGNRFIVQKHDATRLHWDLRLEVDGVLKSWAVTRGPSADPAEKRLAVRTEDHPLAYAGFEGSIPKGEYGGGTVMLWDRGTWEPVPGKSARDIDEGHLHFILHGERMSGEWLLVRMKPRGGEKRENWLLRKIADNHAGGSDDLVNRHLTSVLTGRTMAAIAADEGGEQSLTGATGANFAHKMEAAARHNSTLAGKRKPTKGKLPAFRPLQLATLVDAVPAGNNWLHEIKYDGYRALVAVAGDQVKVFTRNGLDWTTKFAGLAAEIAALDIPSALIDGEIVATDANGNPDFSALQAVLKRGHGEQGATQLQFFAFDLLEHDGASLTTLGNLERKERLEALLGHATGNIAVADHVIGAGEQLYQAMCKAGQEGIIAKRADASYAGRRSHNWVKVKCTLRQEFVLVGWKESSTRARPFASLLLAQHEDGKLVYKGNVGTGFDAKTLSALAGKFARIDRKTAPVEVDRAVARRVHWLKPELVAEVGFAEYTASGSVRHASFIGLRGDKEAADVTPETRQQAPSPGPTVRISNRDRVIFPEAKATKGDLADYYAAMAPIMLPHLARRPLSLVRCPQGRAKKCFFQKHDSGSFGESVHHVPIREKDGGTEDYLYVEDADGVLACVQMGTIEFHGWGCHVETLEQPDRMVFDLDPDEGLGFAEVKKAATDLRRHLADIGLVSFAMLSGGKGVHVVVPLDPGHSWDAHKDFARRFAEALSLAEPDRFVATMSKAKRKGKIFIDYLRNQRGSTAILPYAARAREGAPVAAPVGWDALADIDTAGRWTIFDAAELLDRAGSAELKGWGFAAQGLPEL